MLVHLTLERVKLIFETITTFLTSLAILLGGGWAFYRYVVLESPESQLALEELKKLCDARGALDIRIKPSNLDNRAAGVLSGIVEMKSVGTRPVEIDFTKEAPLIFSEVVFIDTGGYQLKFVRKAFFQDAGHESPPGITKYLILPGRTFEAPYIERFQAGQFYMVTFRGGEMKIVADSSERKEECKTFEPDPKENQWRWHAHAILRVPQ
jgi:hypothetical protein